MKRKKVIVTMIMVLTFSIGAIPASAATRTATYYRGSCLMWTRDNVEFNYKKGKVTSSYGDQECGWVFPNIARNNGIKRTQKSSSQHKWKAKNTIGAGIPTPWGDVKVYSSDFIHRLIVNGDGSWSAYSE